MAQATFSCPFGPIHLESTPLRFRLAAKTATASLLLLFPANPLRWASPGVRERLTKTPLGTAQDERSALIFAHPTPSDPSGHLPLTGGVCPGPHYGGRVPESQQKISGAQNLSGWSKFLPGHFVVADFVSLASSCRTKLAHSIAPPLQRKPTSLGFALGAAFGGLFGWKIAAAVVQLLRLALPNQRSRSGFRRRGGCPHPPAYCLNALS